MAGAGRDPLEVVAQRLSTEGVRINWWRVLGLLSMVASAFLSITILVEIMRLIRSAGQAGLLLPGG